MAYCNHPFDTQTNESLNQAIATIAPKNVCYSSTGSLYSRVALVIAIHNLGYEEGFRRICEKLTVDMENLTQYLHLRDKRKEMKRQYVRKVEVKVRRSKQQKKN
jgi:hypothetical protein